MDETREERFQRGMQVRAEVLGPDYIAARAKNTTTDPVILNWQRYLAEEGWGGVWSRDGLDRKYRSLITITVLTAAGKSNELGLHLVGALRNGWSREELGEAMIHMSTYVGYPSVVEAFRVLQRVFEENPDLDPERGSSN